MAFRIREKGYGIRDKGFFPFAHGPWLLALLFIVMLFPSKSIAVTADYSQDLSDFINIEIKSWVNSDIVIDNLTKQNEISANYNESNLKALDNSWRGEYRKINQPTINQVLTSELSQFLQKKMADSQGVFTEITIIDSKGLNMAQTIISEDCWNVGKPRWDKTFKEKSYVPYISDVYYSDKTNKFQVEVSFMIISNDQPIGVIDAGIDVEQLDDWKKRRK